MLPALRLEADYLSSQRCIARYKIAFVCARTIDYEF